MQATMEAPTTNPVLTPDDARRLTEDERSRRAEYMYQLYESGLSLAEVGRRCGGVSKQRVFQVLNDFGYTTRPAPGTSLWRATKRQEEERKRAEEEAALQAKVDSLLGEGAA